ncbi:WhiB family transcriptional regulator [Rhodococcus opacus]|uniref:WhiB family transcriptional regulator n=1 Tax=Rhodococcus opacus TaxID=37919 RepID=UPI0029552ED8|nr:WhiB family transcriptional regulator [Rhodococcus opacus]MDV7088937.1 WhiB family transcriptional regulator [Rhodococcus opacus]WKN60226.1 WhiB family transcriptional regulator [Rhodococcus opacus]
MSAQDREEKSPPGYLPGQHAHFSADIGWQQFARCKIMDTDAFYSPDDEGKGPRVRRERVAKQMCNECVVQIRCRMHALLTAEQYGVWGGLSESERRRVRPPYRFESAAS